MKAETGIEAGTLTTLHTHVTFKNDEHVYAIHVARAPDGVAPRPSRELTQFKWMRDFANDFSTETKEAVHRRGYGLGAGGCVGPFASGVLS